MKFIQFKKPRKTKEIVEENVSEIQTQSESENDVAETTNFSEASTNLLADDATSQSEDDTATSQSRDDATNQLDEDITNNSSDNPAGQFDNSAIADSDDYSTSQSEDDTANKPEISAKAEKQNERTNDSLGKALENKNASAEKILEADENGRPIHRLRVSSLYKTFGRKTVVKGIDFSMSTGEVLGLLGPNGAGKTTTFYMIVGFYQPSAGDIFLNEEQITGLPMFKRARLGISYLPQEPSVFKKLTVEENIWSILETRNDLSKSEKKQRLEELIEEFAIGRIRKQPAFTLSGGERRRTEIARSLAIEPKFLLLDEPFAGIDPIAVADIKGMIGLLAKRGIGILITDHNVRDTLEITDRAIIVSTGQIAIQGTKQEILDSELAREVYLGKDFSM